MAAPTIQDFADALEVATEEQKIVLLDANGDVLDWSVPIDTKCKTLKMVAASKLGKPPGRIRIWTRGCATPVGADVILSAGTYKIKDAPAPGYVYKAAKLANQEQTQELGKMITEAKNQGVQEVKHLIDGLEERLVIANTTCANAVLDEVWKEGQMCRAETFHTAKIAVEQTMQVQSEIQSKKPIGNSAAEKRLYAGRMVWEWQKQVHDCKNLENREKSLKKLASLAKKTDKDGYFNFPNRSVFYPKPTAGQQTLAPKNEKGKKKADPKQASAPPAKKAKSAASSAVVPRTSSAASSAVVPRTSSAASAVVPRTSSAALSAVVPRNSSAASAVVPRTSSAASEVVPRTVSVTVVSDDGEDGCYKIKPTTPLGIVKKDWCDANYLNVEDVTLRWSNTDLNDAATLISFRELNLQDVVKIQAVVTI